MKKLYLVRHARLFMVTLLLLATSQGYTKEEGKLFHYDIRGNCLDLSTWHHQYRDRCYFLGGSNLQNKYTDTIQVILDELRNEPDLAVYLLDSARKLNTAFCIEDRADGCRGYFDYNYNIIAVRKKLDLFIKVIIFVHELRHVDQVSRGFSQSLDYDANEMVRLNFAVEADANAVLALYAWRLKENGYPQTWAQLFELSQYSDIYSAFRTEIESSKDELKATRAAFIQWYKSKWRTVNYYRSSLGGYHDMLDDTNLIQRYDKLPENYFNNLCTLPDGENYGCHLTEEIKKYQDKPFMK